MVITSSSAHRLLPPHPPVPLQLKKQTNKHLLIHLSIYQSLLLESPFLAFHIDCGAVRTKITQKMTISFQRYCCFCTPAHHFFPTLRISPCSPGSRQITFGLRKAKMLG